MKIYLLYTGGTIGCVGNPLNPLQGPAFVSAFKNNVEGIITSQMPGTTITYEYFQQTLDSTNMQPSDWVLIAQKILANYAQNDAFLVLHGTDTMAWTASALSFLLPGLSKPVFVTGSQLPMFYQQGASTFSLLFNTDALRNVLGAIGFMQFGVPEVGLYFADNLYRGNRVVKSNASQFPAFSSPNFPALGTFGVLPVLNDPLTLPTPSTNALDNNISKVQDNLVKIWGNINSKSVIQFLLFPAYYDQRSGASLIVSMLELLSEGNIALKGIIFEAYGEGNIPDFSQMQDLLKKLDKKKDPILMVDCTQVYSGDVNYNAYATGAWLKGAGVISGYDMTPIAALTKLIVQLAQNPTASQDAVKNTMGTSLAGEMVMYYGLSGYQNQFLAPGQSLYSINGNYQFTNQPNGDLVLYNVSGTQPVQAWKHSCGAEGRLVMQGDCNLVFYDRDFKPLFASNTQAIGTNAYFQVNNDGTLCIYDLYTGTLIKRLN